eukprot:3167467-Rhodomonas_salina.1
MQLKVAEDGAGPEPSAVGGAGGGLYQLQQVVLVVVVADVRLNYAPQTQTQTHRQTDRQTDRQTENTHT